MNNKEEIIEALIHGRLREVNKRWPKIFGKNKFQEFERWIATQKDEELITITFNLGGQTTNNQMENYSCILSGSPVYQNGCIEVSGMSFSPSSNFPFGYLFS